MKDSLIVVSGGMDSITLLYEYADRIALAVSFDYEANHNHKEIPFARIHCERLKIKHIVIPLAFMKEYFRSSLLDGSDSVPEGHYADENMKSTVVPFRNGIMLSIACGIAESNGLKQVLIANHGGDHAIYPDCLTLDVGDLIFQYTDGVTEATNVENQLYGMERLEQVLNRVKDRTPSEILPEVKKDIDAFVGEAPQFDDITMLCVEYKAKMKKA